MLYSFRQFVNAKLQFWFCSFQREQCAGRIAEKRALALDYCRPKELGTQPCSATRRATLLSKRFRSLDVRLPVNFLASERDTPTAAS
jgi:hypothetical protein